MTDIALVESESPVATLHTEQIKKAAELIKDSVRKTLSSWPEYQNPRLMEQETTEEFARPQGQNGEGLWEVTDRGPYIVCNLINSGGKWAITIQSSDQAPYQNPVLSVRRMKNEDKQEISESPPNNSKAALDLVMKFVQEINGGMIPPELSKLGGEKFV